MLRKTPEHGFGSGSPKPGVSAASLLITLSAFMTLCAKKAGRVSRKLKTKTKSFSRKIEPGSSTSTASVTRPKELITTLSNKAIKFMHRKKVGEEVGSGPRPTHGPKLPVEDDWGDGGVWQRSILMGDKCQPLDFSGVIYYDNNGRQMDEVPLRSPRASPLPGYLAARTGKSEP
ncbi:Transmembrane protein [Fagus crenata]